MACKNPYVNYVKTPIVNYVVKKQCGKKKQCGNQNLKL